MKNANSSVEAFKYNVSCVIDFTIINLFLCIFSKQAESAAIMIKKSICLVSSYKKEQGFFMFQCFCCSHTTGCTVNRSTHIHAVITYFPSSFLSLTSQASLCHFFRECIFHLHWGSLKLKPVMKCFESQRYSNNDHTETLCLLFVHMPTEGSKSVL